MVGSVYRSGNDSTENDNLLLDKINEANELAGDNRLLILGDFNMPNINWEEWDLMRGAIRIEEQFLDTISDCYLHQHVKAGSGKE